MKSLLADEGTLIIVDNVSEVATPKRILNVAGAYLDFFPNIVKYGYNSGVRIFKHSTSKEWLDHLSSDVYLSQKEARKLYEDTLKASSIHRFDCFIGVVWQKERL